MPTLSFKCPKCAKTHDRIKPEMAGFKVRCQCGFVVRLGPKSAQNKSKFKKNVRSESAGKSKSGNSQSAASKPKKKKSRTEKIRYSESSLGSAFEGVADKKKQNRGEFLAGAPTGINHSDDDLMDAIEAPKERPQRPSSFSSERTISEEESEQVFGDSFDALTTLQPEGDSFESGESFESFESMESLDPIEDVLEPIPVDDDDGEEIFEAISLPAEADPLMNDPLLNDPFLSTAIPAAPITPAWQSGGGSRSRSRSRQTRTRSRRDGPALDSVAGPIWTLVLSFISTISMLVIMIGLFLPGVAAAFLAITDGTVTVTLIFGLILCSVGSLVSIALTIFLVISGIVAILELSSDTHKGWAIRWAGIMAFSLLGCYFLMVVNAVGTILYAQHVAESMGRKVTNSDVGGAIGVVIVVFLFASIVPIAVGITGVMRNRD